MITTLLALAGIMVLNFENDSQKCAHHVSCNVYQHIFFFGHHRCHNHFVLRVDWIPPFCRLKNRTKQNPLQTFCIERLSRRKKNKQKKPFCRSLFNNFFNLIIQTQTESATEKINVPTNILDVPTDLVRTKSGRGINCPLPHLGYANDHLCWWSYSTKINELRTSWEIQWNSDQQTSFNTES